MNSEKVVEYSEPLGRALVVFSRDFGGAITEVSSVLRIQKDGTPKATTGEAAMAIAKKFCLENFR